MRGDVTLRTSFGSIFRRSRDCRQCRLTPIPSWDRRHSVSGVKEAPITLPYVPLTHQIPIGLRPESLGQEIHEGADFGRQVAGVGIDGVDADFLGDEVFEDLDQGSGLKVGSDDEGGQQGQAQTP